MANVFVKNKKNGITYVYQSESYSMQELLDELDVIECFEQPGATRRIGEITSKQKMLYENLGVPPLGSL
ncbi:MAG: hypothetical protein RSD95_17230 [Clostridia bacterium]